LGLDTHWLGRPHPLTPDTSDTLKKKNPRAAYCRSGDSLGGDGFPWKYVSQSLKPRDRTSAAVIRWTSSGGNQVNKSRPIRTSAIRRGRPFIRTIRTRTRSESAVNWPALMNA